MLLFIPPQYMGATFKGRAQFPTQTRDHNTLCTRVGTEGR